MTAATWTIVAILAGATFIRSALGFGEALVAVPLLALLVPVNVAAPLAVLASITVAAIVVVQDRRSIHIASAARMVAATLVGTPIGLAVLTRAPEAVVKIALAVVIIAFSSYALTTRRRSAPVAAGNGLAWASGLAAGILGGAYGMNGPPLVIYGTLRGWSPREFRATLQGYFLPASLAAFAGYWLTGLVGSRVLHDYLFALPGILAAVARGQSAARRRHVSPLRSRRTHRDWRDPAAAGHRATLTRAAPSTISFSPLWTCEGPLSTFNHLTAGGGEPNRRTPLEEGSMEL